MNFRIQTSPYLRDPRATIPKMMLNVVIALIPVMLFALFAYKLDYVITLILSLVSVVGSEYVSNIVMKREQSISDFSGVVTAIIFSLIITLYTPWYVILIAGAFATVFSKMIFGGIGQNLFNPAAVARIFILFCFSALISNFTDASSSATTLAILGEGDSLTNSFTNVINSTDLQSILFGGHYGTYGETSFIPILIGAFWLLYSKAADYRLMIVSIITFALMNIVVVLANDLPFEFVIYQLCAGGFLFGAVFMITDPVTAPTYGLARIFTAMLYAGVVFVIRFLGSYPEGVLFAILICNMFAPLLDHYTFVSSKLNRGWIITFAVSAVLLFVLALLV